MQRNSTTIQDVTGKVALTNAKFYCTNCKQWKPAKEFGLRRMTRDGLIRNQAQCKSCRGVKG